MRPLIDHALEDLLRRTTRHGVIDESGVGRLLLAAKQIGAEEAARRILAVVFDETVMAREPRTQGQNETLVARVTRQRCARLTEMNCFGRFVLQLNVA